MGLGASLGSQNAYALNPAHDFGPRLMAASFGNDNDVWTFRHQDRDLLMGGIVGSLIYDFFVHTGLDSPLGSKL
ncbi:hypothetical protein CROQUDRAFT_93957 [Cronartium quercuum f. sp. fusiforme G11]|uniref:Uncharacterized protein n=1 Tax=Cronartium quercuum f. sp. fusiforme G11 TaxID=708437 RepID=A0A9P6NGU8_9BASI|nr:hypothetical protein CROQUDRAFT_93957 [Cronartium quercuum f. sp. fusiforme G11]